ncbi:3-isopropylmalate dehydratase large subunit [Paraburkholderia sp.]|uniref:3-isopropylmalate dehydratase large subunit n=1 Tax=Paraburkholderia sp. TaxID=1926495 RepID=UPI0039E6F7E7
MVLSPSATTYASALVVASPNGGMTIVEKILARAAGLPCVAPGDIVDVMVDTAVLIDTNFYPAAWRDILQVADPDRVVIIFDHRAPAADLRSAHAHRVGRAFAERFGIRRVHDIGRDMGISHTVVAEQRYARPGSLLVCDDSHTCAAGAFNCAARGVGEPDMIYSVATGRSWFEVTGTVRYDMVGTLASGVTSKDLFLWIADRFGAHTNLNVEFGGSGLAQISLEARRTLSTMAAELSADFAIFEPDELVLAFFSAGTESTSASSAIPDSLAPVWPDADARYISRITLDLNEVEPLVARPDAIIGNVVNVAAVAGETVHQAFIGSCANGGIEDLAIAARILRGRRVANGVRLIVTPSSQAVYREALRAGYVETLMEAGAVVTNATCGACFGGHMGVLAAGETCITASTRNFRGRMGDPAARIYMASPATVAASAVAGRIADPRDFLRGSR